MSRGSKIYKRFGLKFAIAYRLRKIKTRIKQKHFIQQLGMFLLILKWKHSKKFRIYSLLRKQKCLITSYKHLEFIALYFNDILQWLESKEYKEQYLNTNHPYPPLLNPQWFRENEEVKGDSIAQSKITNTIDCHEVVPTSCNDAKQSTKQNGILTHNVIESNNTQTQSTQSQGAESHNTQSHPKLSYQDIPAELAWEMNLPLPRRYKFVYWGGHATGSIGFITFMEHLKVDNYQFLDYPPKTRYIKMLNELSRRQDSNAYLIIKEFRFNKYEKFLSLFPYSKSLNLVRDPISTLKTLIQLTIPKEGWEKRTKFPIMITLDSNPNKICQNLVRYSNINKDGQYVINGESPSLKVIEFFINPNKYEGIFHDTQLKKALINLKDSIIVDMSEIIGEKTFATMARLSKEFGLPMPKEEDRNKLKTKRVMEYFMLLPIILKVNVFGNIVKIYIKDSAIKSDFSDITKSLLDKDCFYDRIIVCAKQEDYAILCQDENILLSVKEYLQNFIPRLQTQKEIEARKRVTEYQVLEYFKEHKDLRIEFKKVLDKHLEFIKAHRPDIIASWKYYQEFERMCEGEDS